MKFLVLTDWVVGTRKQANEDVVEAAHAMEAVRDVLADIPANADQINITVCEAKTDETFH